jgi:hypothetical protein
MATASTAAAMVPALIVLSLIQNPVALETQVYRVYNAPYRINSSVIFRSIGRLPKPNCEDLSANFRISCTAEASKSSPVKRGADPRRMQR